MFSPGADLQRVPKDEQMIASCVVTPLREALRGKEAVISVLSLA
jgi:hypothetical protein